MGFKEWRYKDINNYKVDKVITNSACIIILFYIIFVFYTYDFNLDTKFYSIKCDSPTPCINPAYKSNHCKGLDFCDMQNLPPGYSKENMPNIYYKYAWQISLLILALAFILNHLIHNKNYKFKLEEEIDKNEIIDSNIQNEGIVNSMEAGRKRRRRRKHKEQDDSEHSIQGGDNTEQSFEDKDNSENKMVSEEDRSIEPDTSDDDKIRP